MAYQISGTSQWKLAGVAFDLQMWCWGCDIKQSEGNLLMEYGFLRSPFPHSNADSHMKNAKPPSTYHLATSRFTVSLGGWGALLSKDDTPTIFIRRDGFKPVLLPRVVHTNIHQLDDLPVEYFENSHTLPELTNEFIRFFENYEEWVLHTKGACYRHECGQKWIKKSPQISAQRLRAYWGELGQILQTAGVAS
ncbi:hypothetical protein [Calycomorphotria hydatis]|uniref:Uncharacterized protein n=1 Tax=Calycomorphotria hydatis TaxID=2528027 RepID=A0A517TA07_9PLAN|nr:hypothetical protein [Calycomorphotria hydatis]QDT65206.1 hypothetical protein V22_24530 [Calycomorphotria hydatis]